MDDSAALDEETPRRCRRSREGALLAVATLGGLVVATLLRGLTSSTDMSGALTRRGDAGTQLLHPQCTLPYEWVDFNSTPKCYGRAWRLQNRRLWPDRGPRTEGYRRQPSLHCDQLSAHSTSIGHSVATGVGGNRWYRFGSPVGSDVQWGLPTEPQRQADASARFDAFTCGTGATAWVSGWDPTSAQRPPRNYRAPGTLPGDGPQWVDAQWQQRVICFEGNAQPPSTQNAATTKESMIEGVLWETWYHTRGRTVGAVVDGDTRFPEWPTYRSLVTPTHPQPWGPNCGGSPLRRDPSVDPDAGGDCGSPGADIDLAASANWMETSTRKEDGAGAGRATALFESPTDIAEHIATRMRTYFRAPETGNYTFVLSSDDFGELWLGNVAPVNERTEAVAEMVASVPGWTEPREWGKYPQQTSRPIAMRHGEYYFMDSLAKENVGGDNLAVGVTLPSGTELRPIPVEMNGTGLLFVDPVMYEYSADMQRGSFEPPLHDVGGSDGSEYQSCMSSVRASTVNCGEFLLWKLPDVPSCATVPMAYCSTPESGLF